MIAQSLRAHAIITITSIALIAPACLEIPPYIGQPSDGDTTADTESETGVDDTDGTTECPNGCATLDAACVVGACVDGACIVQPRDGAPLCDDGDPCTLGDHCFEGACAASPKPCDDGVACTVDTCGPVTGNCIFTPGTSPACACLSDADCDDGAKCNGTETCDLTTYTCTDGTAADTGTDCDDGDWCTTDDICDAGVCVGSARDCSDAGPACATEKSCDTSTARCIWSVANCDCAKDADCGDTTLCNGVETCGADLKCVAGITVDCPASGDICKPNACDAGTGICVGLTAANGLVCEGDNPCTDKTCIDGECTGAPLWDTPCDVPVGVGFCRNEECRPRKIAGHSSLRCVLVHGEIRCAGDNEVGQLGLGTTETVQNLALATSINAPSIGLFIDLAVAGKNACGLLEDGKVLCWGEKKALPRPDNYLGCFGVDFRDHLGDDEALTPACIVGFMQPVIALSNGGTSSEFWVHFADGGMATIGRFLPNWPDFDGISAILKPPEQPIIYPGGVDFPVRQLAFSKNNACLLSDDDEVRCWGPIGARLGLPEMKTDLSAAEAGLVDFGGAPIAALWALDRAFLVQTHDTPPQYFGWGELSVYSGWSFPPFEDIGDDETPGSIPPLDFGDWAPAEVDDHVVLCGRSEAGEVRCWGIISAATFGDIVNELADWGPEPSKAFVVPLDGIAVSLMANCAIFLDGRVQCFETKTEANPIQPPITLP